ncbi:hypothetical protein G6F70_002731 [Rhizopus microsporus]|nr:hypothetical protein G6F71_003898 [Rhizopus microsporus]KAG1201912.1 hypothetical protein G6F70_002731 [Rhizopus microsporus]KAG1210525.1 hypothetical protein G6F69_005411 [Rhizopus microsporus]KAG1232217.1 hypothetical protein G6F67_005184 [Rhizopus microsporus]KAG1264388.1 hypothetical protein G6F68_004393 [Rhizopus microsporus]
MMNQEDKWFEQASNYLTEHDIRLPDNKKLHFYGLFKQATVGDVNTSRPSLFEFVARAKWDAWNKCKGLSPAEAKLKYIESVEELNVGWSRQGLYDYTPSEDHNETSAGLGPAVSCMTYDSEEETDDVFGYARQNDAESLLAAINTNKDLLYAKDEDGLSVLHYAADRGYLDIVKHLIDAGADINIQSDDQETPLHLACISEQLGVAKLLIEKGCNRDLKDAEGKTAFEHADKSFIEQLNI